MLKLSAPQAAFIGFDSNSLTLQSSPSERCMASARTMSYQSTLDLLPVPGDPSFRVRVLNRSDLDQVVALFFASESQDGQHS
jgi:hypothetical protein